MKSARAAGEYVLREYPRSTRWIEDRWVAGVGNFILTNRRMIFLNRVVLSDEQTEKLRQMGEEEAPVKQALDYVLTLNKKNFQIPLSALVSVKVGLQSILPLPRPCLRVYYGGRKKLKSATFMFTIPLLKGFYQFELTTVLAWVWIIRRAARDRDR